MPVTACLAPDTCTSRTVISFWVSVPVLSEQMTVAAPSVSTAASLRTMAPRLAIRCIPRASVIVVMAGSPSGMAATARLTASRRSSFHVRSPLIIPRTKRRPDSARHAQRIFLPNVSSFSSSGVFCCPALWMSVESLPISVRGPVATTTAVARPRTRLVDRKTMLVWSPIGASSWTAARASLFTGIDSPVSADSSTATFDVTRRRASAGTASPASSSRMSPSTSSVAGSFTSLSPRRTLASGTCIFWSASSAASARLSW